MSDIKSKIYEIQLVSVLSIMLIINLTNLILYNVIMSIVPIGILCVVLFLYLSKNKFSSLGIKVWATFLIVGGGAGLLQILAVLCIKLLGAEYSESVLSFKNIIIKSVFLVYGIYVFVGANAVKAKIESEAANEVV